jgi:putative DNA primase/helicase
MIANIRADSNAEDPMGYAEGASMLQVPEEQPDIRGYFVLGNKKPEMAPEQLLLVPPTNGKFAEVFNEDIICVQTENDSVAEKIQNALEEYKVKYRAVANKDFIRFFFRGDLPAPNYLGQLMNGSQAEVASNYGFLEHLEGKIKLLHEDKIYDELPQWLYPTKDSSAIDSSLSMIGESTWISYTKQIYDRLRGHGRAKNKAAYASTIESAVVLNKYFRRHPFDETRMKSFLDIMEYNKPNFYEKQLDEDGRTKVKFAKDKFCEWIIERYRLINLDYLPYGYSNGIYTYRTDDDIEMLLMKYLRDSNASFRKEIRSSIFSLLGVYGQRTDSEKDSPFVVHHLARPEIIAFENGLLDIRTGKLMPFTDKIIVTNRVPWEYVDFTNLIKEGKRTEAMKLVENWLDSFSENNYDKRLVLEEVMGLCLYRKNHGIRRQHTILVGPKESGKSTFIKIVETLVAESNCSHVPIETICNSNDRFSVVTMVGKALNTYGDISKRAILDASRLKNLCTGDSILVEQKNQPAFSMSYFGKMLFGANEMPRVDDTAISSRFEFIKCSADYNSRGTKCIPDLYERLTREECMTYIVYLAVEGLKRFIGQNYKHSYCAENEELRRQYEQLNNPVNAFVEAFGAEAIADRDSNEVYEKYLDFLVNDLKLPDSYCNPTKNSFTMGLKRLGFGTKRKSVNNKKITVYIKEN